MSAYLLKPGETLTFNGQEIGIIQQIRTTRDGYGMETHSIDVINKPAMPKGKSLVTDTKYIWGVPGWKKDYRGNLMGNVRIKYRVDDFAKIYIRDPYRIRCFMLLYEKDGDYVTHGEEISQTQRTTPRTK